MKSILTGSAPLPVGPYSQAVLSTGGEYLFLSGQLGLDLSGAIVKGSVEAEAKQVFANIEAVLAAAGMGRRNVVKTTIFLKDMNDFSVVNSLYETFFGDHRPARSTIEVSRLPKGGLIEIEAIAVKAGGSSCQESTSAEVE
ncbi:MAG TPA: RidA family protein [Syntrophorhabdaceae bacterium]|nr:RidA family protein [Syntrophorhabdaceae bacterium]